MKKQLLVLTIVCFMFAGFPLGAFGEPITIDWWFAHGGRLGEKVQSIVSDFNASQNQYKVVATYKGNYHDTMTAGRRATIPREPITRRSRVCPLRACLKIPRSTASG